MAEKYGITIAEGLAAKMQATPKTANRYNALRKFIEASELSFDDDMSVLNSKKGYDTLLDVVRNHPELKLDITGKVRSESNTGAIAADFYALINFNKPSGVGSNYFTDEEARLSKSKQGHKGFNRAAARTKASISLPPQDKLHMVLERALQKIDDPDVKSWFTVKLTTGLRDPDITQIEFEPEDMSLRRDGVKYLSRTDGTVRIYNKNNPMPYSLGDAVHAVLHEQASRAERAGRSTLWPIPSAEEILHKTGINDYNNDLVAQAHADSTKKIETKYKKIIADAVNEELNKEGLQIFDYKKNEYIKFTVSHLRKNVFDVLEESLGPDIANNVLGHNTGKDMGMEHYKVMRGGRKTAFSKALDEFVRLYLSDIGIANPVNWLNSLGFKEAAKNMPEVIPETELGRIQNQAEVVQSDAKSDAIKLSKEAEIAAESIETSATRAEAGVERLRAASEQMEAIIGDPETKTIDQMSNEERNRLFDENKLYGETDTDVEFRLRRERGEVISPEFQKSIDRQNIADRDNKVILQNKMSGVVRPKGFKPRTPVITSEVEAPVTQQMETLALPESKITGPLPASASTEEVLERVRQITGEDTPKPDIPKKEPIQVYDDEVNKALPEFLQEGPAQDTPKKDNTFKKILKKVGRKLPFIGAGVGAAFMLKEVLAEQEWRKRNAGRASINDLDRSRQREQYFKLASLEEAASPLPFTTGDKREVEIDKAVRKELETLPEFKQIQKSLSGLTKAKVGRSGPPIRDRRARVGERKAMTSDISALAKRRSEMEAKVRSAVDERNVMDLQGEIDYTKGTEGMQRGFAQPRSI